MEEARRRWDLTLAWREKESVDAILLEPQPYFEHIKRHYPHGVHRQAKNGNYVYIERPPKADLEGLFESNEGVTMEAVLRHYVFITEFIWTELDPREDGQLVTIMDVEGVGLYDLVGIALEFLTKASYIVQSHYVERQSKIFVLNAPYWFSTLWMVVSPFMSENTLQKVEILGDISEYGPRLQEVIDVESLPTIFGGRDVDTEFMQSPEEKKLWRHVRKVNAGEDPFEESDEENGEDDEDEEDEDELC